MERWRGKIMCALAAFERIKNEERQVQELYEVSQKIECREKLQDRLATLHRQAYEKNMEILELLRDYPGESPAVKAGRVFH